MTDWTRHRLTDMLNEVGAYALEPEDVPTDIERTYGYYAGWRSCIMNMQERVRDSDVMVPDEMYAIVDGARCTGESMRHGLAFTHEATADIPDLGDAAVGDARLRVLVQYATGWVAAAEKVDERLRQVEDHVFSEV